MARVTEALIRARLATLSVEPVVTCKGEVRQRATLSIQGAPRWTGDGDTLAEALRQLEWGVCLGMREVFIAAGAKRRHQRERSRKVGRC